MTKLQVTDQINQTKGELAKAEARIAELRAALDSATARYNQLVGVLSVFTQLSDLGATEIDVPRAAAIDAPPTPPPAPEATQ